MRRFVLVGVVLLIVWGWQANVLEEAIHPNPTDQNPWGPGLVLFWWGVLAYSLLGWAEWATKKEEKKKKERPEFLFPEKEKTTH